MLTEVKGPVKGEKSLPKTNRNISIFREWYSGIQAYMFSADSKDKVSYSYLSNKYGLSVPTIRTICLRELKHHNNKFKL